MSDTSWFTNARFGMFVHWGLYSLPAGVWEGKKIKHDYAEWLQASERVPRNVYRKLAAEFNPETFDADAWIAAAKQAGMKYFVITSKHHDGFALWPSKASAFNVVDATPFKRDILKELAEACRKYDIKLGLYYSHWLDWEGVGGDVCSAHMLNDEYRRPADEEFGHYWNAKCLPQIQELIEGYAPALFWFDTWSAESLNYVSREREDELISLVKRLSPDCLINSRIQFMTPSDRVDFISTMDNCFPEEGFDKPWETSGTLNNSWAYHQLDFDWKPTEDLLKYLISNASLGGNYQLNVGPIGSGEFQAAAHKRLTEIGAWLAVNGEAIYGTEKSPCGIPPWGRITCKISANGGQVLYLHLFNPASADEIEVEGITRSVTSARVLETGQELLCEAGSKGLVVHLTPQLQNLLLPVVRIDLFS